MLKMNFYYFYLTYLTIRKKDFAMTLFATLFV